MRTAEGAKIRWKKGESQRGENLRNCHCHDTGRRKRADAEGLLGGVWGSFVVVFGVGCLFWGFLWVGASSFRGGPWGKEIEQIGSRSFQRLAVSS